MYGKQLPSFALNVSKNLQKNNFHISHDGPIPMGRDWSGIRYTVYLPTDWSRKALINGKEMDRSDPWVWYVGCRGV